MIRIPLVIACAVVATLAYAQAPATNCRALTLLDRVGEAVPFATVELPDERGSLQADANGRVCVPSDVREVRIVSAFTTATSIRLDTLAGEILRLPSVELATVDVRANRVFTEEGFSFTQEVMERLPAIGGEVDALKSLQALPSVGMLAEGQAAPAIRGGTVDQTLVLMDGAVLYSPNHLLGFLGSVNADAVQDLRVYTGQFPAKYGGRLSGVVSATTKRGRDDRHAGSFSLGFPNSNIRLEGPTGRKGSYFLAGRLAYPAVAALSTGSVFLQGDLNVKYTLPLSKGRQLTLAGYGSQDYINSTEDVEVGATGESARARTRYGWGNQLLSARFLATPGGWLTETGVTYSRYGTGSGLSLPNPELSDGRYQTSVRTSRTGVTGWGTAAKDFRRGNLELSARVEIGKYNLEVDVPPALTAELPRAEFDLYNPRLVDANIGIDYTYDITDQFALGAGLRTSGLSAGNYNTFVLEPRLSARLEVSETRLSLAFDRMSQPLHRLDPWAFEGYFEVFLPPSDAYPIQLANQYSVQIDRPLGGVRGSIRASGYYKKMGPVPFFNSGAEVFSDLSTPDPDIPKSDGYAYGVELFTTGRVRDIDFMFGYAYARTFYRNPFNESDRVGDFLEYRFSRPHQLTTNLAYRPTASAWRFRATLVFASGFLYTQPQLRPGRSIFLNNSFQGIEASRALYTSRDYVRSPAHHRLDLGATYSKQGRSLLHEWTFSLYNAYARKNPFYISYNGPVVEQGENVRYNAPALFRGIPGIQWTITW